MKLHRYFSRARTMRNWRGAQPHDCHVRIQLLLRSRGSLRRHKPLPRRPHAGPSDIAYAATGTWSDDQSTINEIADRTQTPQRDGAMARWKHIQARQTKAEC